MKIVNKYMSLPPKTIFLVDAVGAIFTCITLGLILPAFSTEFGVNQSIFHRLAALVAFYFLYSITIFWIQPSRWVKYLQFIAAANLIYCMVTITVIIFLNSNTTTLGIIYFIGEALIITLISFLEFTYAKKNRSVRTSSI